MMQRGPVTLDFPGIYKINRSNEDPDCIQVSDGVWENQEVVAKIWLQLCRIWNVFGWFLGGWKGKDQADQNSFGWKQLFWGREEAMMKSYFKLDQRNTGIWYIPSLQLT